LPEISRDIRDIYDVTGNAKILATTQKPRRVAFIQHFERCFVYGRL